MGSIQTKGYNITKEVMINQSGSGTLSHEKAASAMGKPSHQFSCRDKTQQMTRLVKAAWTSELNADCGSGETSRSLWKQMLQEDAWHVMQRTQNEEICCILMCMETGQRHHWTSGGFTVNRHASQVIMVQSCLPSRYAAKNHTPRNSRR